LQVCDYIKSYAEHFDLNRDIRLNTPVQWIKRNPEDTKWVVCVKSEHGEEVNEFDRIALCDGLVSKATTPEFEGTKKFRGKIIHSQAYKRYVILY
jgi:dimethylaniline monooxygenase (N-oxide forming)